MTGKHDDDDSPSPSVTQKGVQRFKAGGSSTKKPHRKASEKQKEELIKFFEANPSYVKIVACNAGDNAMKNKIWASIARRLNEIDGGVLKSELKWAKSWADMKVYAKSRAKLAVAGLAPQNAKRPTELDRRILTIIGQEELLIGWESSLIEDSNSPSTRQVPLEHDYELTGFQDTDDTVDINFLEETEERLDTEEYLDQAQPSTSTQRQKPQTIRQAINRFSDNDGIETMEFYIEDEHHEEVHVMNDPPEMRVGPRPKRVKREQTVYTVAEPKVIKKEAEQEDQYAKAMMTLADALNNVAGALYTISETIRTVKR